MILYRQNQELSMILYRQYYESYVIIKIRQSHITQGLQWKEQYFKSLF